MSTAGQLVWYVGYASNLDRARFLVYIQGGSAPGRSYFQPGCADRTLPRADHAISIDHELYFAGESPIYKGGVAFVSPQTGGQPTKARAYLVTYEQFCEIVQQENHCDQPIAIPTVAQIRRQNGAILRPNQQTLSQYTRLLYCGELDGHPLLSFTAPELPAKYVAPSAAYIRTIGRGLHQSHHLSSADVAAYLATKPGVSGAYTPEHLQTILDTDPLLSPSAP
ncbi:MAG TPA: hypothetical protein VLF67_02150 [Candidatus Saccharimonas sp.]|nr:hypothetical protein [Candidatus Saccharimonas sp.]